MLFGRDIVARRRIHHQNPFRDAPRFCQKDLPSRRIEVPIKMGRYQALELHRSEGQVKRIALNKRSARNPRAGYRQHGRALVQSDHTAAQSGRQKPGSTRDVQDGTKAKRGQDTFERSAFLGPAWTNSLLEETGAEVPIIIFGSPPIIVEPLRLGHYDNRARTFSLSALPSTRLPASLACAAFITRPICFCEVAPVSASACPMASSIS